MVRDFIWQAQDFAARLEDTINQALPGGSRIRASRLGTRVRVFAVDQEDQPARLPLFCNGNQLAWWQLTMLTTTSKDGRYLKIDSQRMSLFPVWEDGPIVRLEFEARARTIPSAHWQFHAERGALSFILARTHTAGNAADVPHSLSKLHLPVGGRRFRPGVEDFIEFLVRECGFDSRSGWDDALAGGREIARRFQIRTIVSSFQNEAAMQLRELGWEVTPPPEYEDSESAETLRKW